jgi:hypothetical protein
VIYLHRQRLPSVSGPTRRCPGLQTHTVTRSNLPLARASLLSVLCSHLLHLVDHVVHSSTDALVRAQAVARRTELAIPVRSVTLRKPAVEQVVPAVARCISSLRHIGYEQPRVVADLVDNIAPEGCKVLSIDLDFDSADSSIRTLNDGRSEHPGAWMSCCTARPEGSSGKITNCLRKTTLGNNAHLLADRC